MSGRKVAVALSGGIDSAVSAALLLKQGYDVFGVTMHLNESATSSPIDTSRNIARKLGIPHHVLDFSALFEKKVITPFCQQYAEGKTPNPCVICNHELKFGSLLDSVKQLGAEYLATGHYARIETKGQTNVLCKAFDKAKDQTYFLYTLKHDILSSLLFPIGDLLKKDVVRLASELSIPVSSDGESHDICFMAGSNYRELLNTCLKTTPGKVYDVSGNEIGSHTGISNYTIGQRQGLNFGQQEKLYVTDIDIYNNSITVGPASYLDKFMLVAGDIKWISGRFPQGIKDITAKIRYGAKEIPVTLKTDGNLLSVTFSSPVKAVAPGQSVVFYSGDEVLGGGIIRY
jgi:tRNA-specific 2-thiouridylase